ncbi:hypothetical protein ZIOFF_051031 [Zingiber officinale]|uniref:Kinesin motor domain-containing protein n=1 Tax=Zingiber officinale TaxID=94328 RepID=A0A8J5KU03_ZINOF|nr:hypothetical protein ZIOFF_051031 [Zingiber officinale]
MRYEFYVSMLEVYNEKIRDLLADSPDQLSKRLDIKQASDGTQDVPGLLEPHVGSIDDVWQILTNGGRNRFVGSTNANELSSRSYSFDSPIIGNNGIKLAGFHVDTMHLARLFDSSRTTDGGYSLEALTSDPKIMSQGNSDDDVELISGKMSTKSIFGGLCVHQSRGRNEMNFESKPLKLFKVLNTEKIFEEGKKAPLKYHTIHLHKICEGLQTDMYTASGFPSLSADALKVFAGNIPSNQIYRIDNACNDEYVTEEGIMDDHKLSDTGTDYEDCSYGTAFEAFGGGNKGREACEAIAALCETSAIDSLITNFIIPLQVN